MNADFDIFDTDSAVAVAPVYYTTIGGDDSSVAVAVLSSHTDTDHGTTSRVLSLVYTKDDDDVSTDTNAAEVDHNGTVVFFIDDSGSMSGKNKEMAIATAAALAPNYLVRYTVVVVRWGSMPIEFMTLDQHDTAEIITTKLQGFLKTNQGTNLLDALLQLGHRVRNGSIGTNVKHVFVLTDGDTDSLVASNIPIYKGLLVVGGMHRTVDTESFRPMPTTDPRLREFRSRSTSVSDNLTALARDIAPNLACFVNKLTLVGIAEAKMEKLANIGLGLSMPAERIKGVTTEDPAAICTAFNVVDRSGATISITIESSASQQDELVLPVLVEYETDNNNNGATRTSYLVPYPASTPNPAAITVGNMWLFPMDDIVPTVNDKVVEWTRTLGMHYAKVTAAVGKLVHSGSKSLASDIARVIQTLSTARSQLVLASNDMNRSAWRTNPFVLAVRYGYVTPVMSIIDEHLDTLKSNVNLAQFDTITCNYTGLPLSTMALDRITHGMKATGGKSSKLARKVEERVARLVEKTRMAAAKIMRERNTIPAMLDQSGCATIVYDGCRYMLPAAATNLEPMLTHPAEECPVCANAIPLDMACANDHRFCTQCVSNLAAFSDDVPQCPECRDDSGFTEIVPRGTTEPLYRGAIVGNTTSCVPCIVLLLGYQIPNSIIDAPDNIPVIKRRLDGTYNAYALLDALASETGTPGAIAAVDRVFTGLPTELDVNQPLLCLSPIETSVLFRRWLNGGRIITGAVNYTGTIKCVSGKDHLQYAAVLRHVISAPVEIGGTMERGVRMCLELASGYAQCATSSEVGPSAAEVVHFTSIGSDGQNAFVPKDVSATLAEVIGAVMTQTDGLATGVDVSLFANTYVRMLDRMYNDSVNVRPGAPKPAELVFDGEAMAPHVAIQHLWGKVITTLCEAAGDASMTRTSFIKTDATDAVIRYATAIKTAASVLMKDVLSLMPVMAQTVTVQRVLTLMSRVRTHVSHLPREQRTLTHLFDTEYDPEIPRELGITTLVDLIAADWSQLQCASPVEFLTDAAEASVFFSVLVAGFCNPSMFKGITPKFATAANKNVIAALKSCVTPSTSTPSPTLTSTLTSSSSLSSRTNVPQSNPAQPVFNSNSFACKIKSKSAAALGEHLLRNSATPEDAHKSITGLGIQTSNAAFTAVNTPITDDAMLERMRCNYCALLCGHYPRINPDTNCPELVKVGERVVAPTSKGARAMRARLFDAKSECHPTLGRFFRNVREQTVYVQSNPHAFL